MTIHVLDSDASGHVIVKHSHLITVKGIRPSCLYGSFDETKSEFFFQLRLQRFSSKLN